MCELSGSHLLFSSGRLKVMLCVVKSFLFNGSCSNFEHLILKIGHIFVPSLEILSSKRKLSFNFLSLKIVGCDKHANRGEKARWFYKLFCVETMVLKYNINNSNLYFRRLLLE